ncbi:MAG: cupin domain-containing protein [Ignavibacteriae bacterium]|jgi:cupin 2 domain-containing protein|nr:cupin domain-containing protein [Ignavibacteriota bacterium]NOG97965.1 cupin domain-containing protein [Ignavibacteriota bacterium]
MEINNLFENIPPKLDEEIIEKILTADNFKVERIISECHSSPKNFWYDQSANEFVLLLKGSACINFENGSSKILKPGDYLIIKAHDKHRVEWTDKNVKTIWLTIHYKN